MRLCSRYATLAASLLVVLAGSWVLWKTTDGLSAFTAEAARRYAVLEKPRPVPAVDLTASDGQTIGMIDPQQRPTLVEFIYTNCPTICISLGQEFFRIQTAAKAAGLDGQIRLLSICFDLERDSPKSMAGYAELHGADSKNWTVARPKNESDLREILDTFGITIIADGDGQYVHNSALHLVDSSGYLRTILDIGEHDVAVAELGRWR